MNQWAMTLFLTTLCYMLLRSFLPKGEKSPFFGPLKLLLSLLILLATLSPLIRLMGKEESLTLHLDPYTETNVLSPEEVILERSRERMAKAVQKAFPEEDVTLSLDVTEDGIPHTIRVCAENEEKGRRIAAFLQENYHLVAILESKEER